MCFIRKLSFTSFIIFASSCLSLFGMDTVVEPQSRDDFDTAEASYIQNRFSVLVAPSIRQLCSSHLEEGLVMQDKLPTVGLVVSGGGERASLATLGFFAALKDAGVLDCSLFAAGLSGGAWGIGTILANLKYRPEMNIIAIKDDLKDRFRFRLNDLSQYNKEALFRVLKSKKLAKQFYGFADIWGQAFLERHLGSIVGFENLKFSEIIPANPASFPLPIFTAAIDIRLAGRCCCGCKHKYESLEFNPFFIRSDYLGCRIPMNQFNSEFEEGVLVERKPEPSLGYIFGICGSAYSLSYQEIMAYVEAAMAERRGDRGFLSNEIWSSLKSGRICPPLVYNFAQGRSTREGCEDSYLALIDGGFINSGVERITNCVNLPLYPILQRQANVIIVLDASEEAYDGNCTQLRNAFAFAAVHGFGNLPSMQPVKEGINYKIFESTGHPEIPTIIYIYNGLAIKTTKFAYTGGEIDQLFDFIYRITASASEDIKTAIKTRSLVI